MRQHRPPTLADALRLLNRKANPRNLAGMQRFGLRAEKRLGVSMPDLRSIARTLGTSHSLAKALWRTGIPDARILASLTADPAKLTTRDADSWVRDLDSWDVCDQLCMNLLEKTPFAYRTVRAWVGEDEEFVRRAGFALLACLAWHAKDVPDAEFETFFPLIEAGAGDGRNYVKKAVSWALRNIGKRNRALNAAAIREARRIGALGQPSARWVASDVIRELSSDGVRRRIVSRVDKRINPK